MMAAGLCSENFVDRLLNLLARRGFVKRITTQSMPKRHRRHALDVFFRNRTAAFKRRERARRTCDRQFTTMSIDFQVRAELRDLLEHALFDRELHQGGASACDSFAQLFLIGVVRLAKRIALAVVSFAAPHDVKTILEIVFSCDFGMKPEAIEQWRTKFAGCSTETPSRSTLLMPVTATSSSRSTRWSSSRLTSSIYKKPRLARASKPGSKAFRPAKSARSISMVPQTRSSVAPKGSSTTGTEVCFVVISTLALH